MKVRPERAGTIDAIARKLLAHKAQYQAVEGATRVPWFVIAALHNRESDADFDTQLAQGDPLDRVSVNEPSGRGPFDTWEESAIDALVTLKHLDRVAAGGGGEWPPARICYETERYNGFGYRNYHPSVKSPYLWSFTTHYTAGKYVADGQYSANAVDKQCGAIPIMKRLMELSGVKTGAPAVKEFLNTGGWLAALVGAMLRMFRKAPSDKPPARSGPPAPAHPASVEPAWMRWAIKEVDFHEIGQNRGIKKYTALAQCGEEGDPWCAIFVNAALEAAGIRGTRSAMARSFERRPESFVRLSGPAYGAVTTMWRGSPGSGLGHVFFYVGENARGILALGGNQSDQVCRQYEPRNRIVGYWWPKSVPLPQAGAVIVSDDANEGSET